MKEEEPVCGFTQCEETENLVGIGPPSREEHYCPDHFEYGIGRAFGAVHRALEAASEHVLGPRQEEGS